MKKIAFLFACALVSSLSFGGKLNRNPEKPSSMAVVKRDESSFNLIYQSESESDVKVQIFNEKKALVFSELIRKSSGFVRPYNFDGLKDGEYTIQVNNGSNGLTQTVNYSAESDEKLAQLIRMSNGKYLLMVAGQGEDVISINVLNEFDETVHSENIPVDGNFAKVFDLRALKGDFAFKVKDSHGVSKTLWRP